MRSRRAREAGESDDAVKFLRQLGLLTAKPILYAANVNEDDLGVGGGKWIEKLRSAVQSHHEEAEIVPFSAKFEAELAELSGDERQEYLASAGVAEPGHVGPDPQAAVATAVDPARGREDRSPAVARRGPGPRELAPGEDRRAVVAGALGPGQHPPAAVEQDERHGQRRQQENGS